MKKRFAWFLPVAALALSVFVTACSDDLSEDSHYKTPDWLKGNAYEVLQKEGNYTTFLKGIDLTGYQSIVGGKSILTVMAPDDAAFSEFLQKKGYSSIEQMYEAEPTYTSNLIGFHLMYYAFDWSKLVNFRPDGGDSETEESKETMAGYYYKHRTHSQDPVEQMRVKMTAGATTDTLLNIYHYQRYLPVFSNKLFETKQIDAEYNYEYFFPETSWETKSNADGYFNVANAEVSDDDNVITDNGYLYHVSKVLEPMLTIYDELKQNSNYSQFLKLYDTYSTYTTADDETNTSLGYIAYQHSHGSLPPIAWEWPVSSWRSVSTLERAGYNLFAPSNTAISNFFQTYWTAQDGYTSFDDLDPLITEYFIKQSFSDERFIVFPEEIKNGTVLTEYQTPINIDPDEVTYRKICCNGALYGMDKMNAPAIFSSVVGPAFKATKYINYLYALDASSLILALASDKADFVTLIPNNQQFENNEPSIRLYTTTTGNELQQYSAEAGAYVSVGSTTLRNIVNMHTATNVSELQTQGTQIVETNTAYNYWYVVDGKITTNALFNQQLEPTYTGDPFVSFSPILKDGQPWDNGSAYSYDAPSLFEAASGDGLAHKLAVGNDKNYPYYLFSQLLQKAGLVTGTTLNSSIITTTDTRFICFVPTNEAIAAAIKSIPGCSALSVVDGAITGTLSSTNKTLLANYLRNYFITNDMNSFTSYPYPGSTCNGRFLTPGGKDIIITDNGTSISAAFDGGTAVSVTSKYHYLPFAFTDGGFHLIDGILQ